MEHDIILSSDVELPEGMEDHVKRVILTALAAQGMNLPCEINVLLTDDAGIQTLNKRMRGIDQATDVLSFPMFDIPEGYLPSALCSDPDTGLIALGDMCISLERARAQAAEFGHSLEREVSYLTVHSVLHLLGYDHTDEGMRKARMREREEAILAELGLTRENETQRN